MVEFARPSNVISQVTRMLFLSQLQVFTFARTFLLYIYFRPTFSVAYTMA